MKAGKEGPMKKNFPKVFAKKFDKDYEPQTRAGGREYEDRVRRSDLDEKGKKIFDSKGYNPQTNKKNTKSTSYKPQSTNPRPLYQPQAGSTKRGTGMILPEPAITGGFDPNLAGPNFNKNKNVKPTVAKKKK